MCASRRDRYSGQESTVALIALSVWLEGVDNPVGSLVSDDYGSIHFTYHEDWLQQANAFGISLSMPLREDAHGDAIARAYFNNLLHENDQLNQLLRRERLERSDIVGILRRLGADCPGAISCLPVDAPPVKHPGNLLTDYDVIDDDEMVDIVQRLATGRPLPAGLRDPSPVAGFRRKISLAQLPDRRFATPKAGLGVPTTHILKIPDPDHRGEAQQEAAAASLARSCGFEASVSVASHIGTQDIMLIERFDRFATSDGRVGRIHQEDFAQAIGLPDGLKYERKATGALRFDSANISSVLAQTSDPAKERERFLRITLFNLMIGNTDNHAKNHALLYLDGASPRLAPLYDMVPIPLGEGYSDEFAFNIGSASRAEELTENDLAAFCIALGYPAGRARAVISRNATEIATALEAASTKLPMELRTFDMLIGREIGRLNDLLQLGLDIRQRDHLPQRAAGGWLMS